MAIRMQTLSKLLLLLKKKNTGNAADGTSSEQSGTASANTSSEENEPPSISHKGNANTKCAMDCMKKPSQVSTANMGNSFNSIIKIHQYLANIFALLVE